MSTANKLTYLATTKSKIKDSINNLGGNITSQTTFRQYATELDNIYSNLPKVSGTGSNISLTPTLKGRLSSTPKGDTYQFSTTGKQLYDISTADYTYKCSLSNEIYTTDALTTSARSVNFGYDANNNYTINDGETYYVSADIRLKSGTSTNVNVLRFNVSGLTTNQVSNPNFTSQFQRYAFSCANNSGSAITTGRFLFQPSSTNLDNAVFEITNVMVSTSSNTSYEPYTGGIASPNPSYPQQIQSATGLQTITISDGTNTQTKELNLGTIELNKIGDYQDYISGTPDNWIINKLINKKILTGATTEGWTLENNGTFGTRNSYFGDRKLLSTSYEGLLSNYYKVSGSGDYYIRWRGSNEYNLNINNKDISTVENFKTWLSTHNTIVYYVLDTPTTETITNQEIINQLNEIYYLQSYNGTTNITITSEDLELIMTASALKGDTQ